MVEADTNDPDLGQRVLEKIHKDLCIDEPWTTRGDRWFSWIGHRLAQRVSAYKPSDDDGIVLSRIEATCVVVADIAAEPSDVVRVLPRINRHAVGSAYTYWPDTHSISADAVAYVHDQTLEWRTNQLGALAILQLWLCETEAAWLAEKTGGRIAVREHPTSGRRLEPDEMLNVLDTQFAADGRKQSLFADKFEMENIAEITRQSTSAASLGGDAGGVTIEVPFGDYTSLIQLNTQEPHRRLGNGLTALLRLPLTVTPDEADLLASMVNAREAAGESKATHYGCRGD